MHHFTLVHFITLGTFYKVAEGLIKLFSIIVTSQNVLIVYLNRDLVLDRMVMSINGSYFLNEFESKYKDAWLHGNSLDELQGSCFRYFTKLFNVSRPRNLFFSVNNMLRGFLLSLYCRAIRLQKVRESII